MTGSRAPHLLNEDGSASMATMLMMSHHAFRRDIAQFGIALRRVAEGDASKVDALRKEWQGYHQALHGHHSIEDAHIFPDLRTKHPSVAAVIDGLSADHRRIDPLLEAGDPAFADLPKSADSAMAVVSELSRLLDAHLATEEEKVVPFLRDAKEFPAPATDAELDMYAEGFAWSSHGVAPEVLDRVYALLPAALTAKLPEARAAFDRRCERVWGSAKAGASQTPVPDWI